MPNLSKKDLTLILIGLGVADFLGAIDSTGVNIALPRITADLGITIVKAAWIPNSYLLALVATLIFFGKVGDRVGAKKLYLIGLYIFGISSLFLGFLNNADAIIFLRIAQGLGTAILYTMPMSIIAHLFKEREKAFSVTASFFAAGMLVGPVAGGVLTALNVGSFQGWHWLFLVNVPLVAIGIVTASRLIPELPSQKATKIDYLSFLLLSIGLVLVVMSLSTISSWYILAGAVLLIILFLYERKITAPLLDLKLFHSQTFSAANLVASIAMVSILGMSFVLTFYLQTILNWDSTQAGLAMLPVPVVTGLAAVFAGKIKNWRLGSLLSSSLIFLGILALDRVVPTVSYFTGVMPALILIGAGSGILMTTVFAAVIGSAPTEKSGSASGFLNTMQQLGGLIGIAIVAGIVLNYHQSFIILTYISILGVVSAFFVRGVSGKLKEDN